MPAQTVLLTGASGLLGSHLLGRLMDEGYRVIAVKRDSSKVDHLPESENLKWITFDSFKDNLFEIAAEPVHIVIHAAALVSYHQRDQSLLFETNTEWTVNLAKVALTHQVKQFIFISSISALGKHSADQIIKENTPHDEKDFYSNYGKSKYQAEKNLRELSKKGLPIIIFNPSVILGPANLDRSSAKLFQYVADQKPFYTKGLINYVDVRDVADSILYAINHAIINEQFILNAGSISYQQFFEKIAQLLNVRPPSLNIPKGFVIAGALMENIWSKISGKMPTLTVETAKMAGSNYYYDHSKHKNAFQFQYRSLQNSLQWTINEMQKSNKI